MTGSFCTYTKAFEQIDRLLEEGAILQTIFSDISQHIKCRFGKGEEFVKRAHDMTGNEPMKTIEEAEIIGPTGCLDILILMPCTGNTMAKLANGITDTPVLMAAKAQLRNEKPAKGKGYAGGIKRHGLKSGPSAHGSKYHRHAGSNGMASDPSKVFKGKKMPGQMGAERVTIQNLEIVKVDADQNIILVKGAVPGPKKSLVMLKESVKA